MSAVWCISTGRRVYVHYVLYSCKCHMLRLHNSHGFKLCHKALRPSSTTSLSVSCVSVLHVKPMVLLSLREAGFLSKVAKKHTSHVAESSSWEFAAKQEVVTSGSAEQALWSPVTFRLCLVKMHPTRLTRGQMHCAVLRRTGLWGPQINGRAAK